MGTTLTGKTIKSTYKGLIKTTDNDALASGVLTRLTDGFGNESDLEISSTSTRTSTMVVTGDATATTFLGDLNGTINTLTTAITKPNITDDTTLATTAFVQNLIGTVPAGLVFQGTWDASTNTPTLTAGTGTTGHFYITSVDGSTNLDGITDWKVGDWAVFVEQGATDQWEKVDNSSVLDGVGTGNQISKWSGSGTSNTLSDSIITDDGTNVGIGKTSMTEKLEVNGAILWEGSLTTSQTSAGVLDRSGNDLRIRAYGDTAGTGNLVFRTGGGGGSVDSESMRIDSDGNVGIGTDNPARILHIEDSLVAAIQLENTSEADSFIDFMNPSRTFRVGYDDSTDSFKVAVSDFNSNALVVNPSGNVGIGTATPTSSFGETTLDITESSGDASLSLKADGNKAFEISSRSGDVLLYDLSGRDLIFGTSGSGKMRIKSDGKVGIGTNTPATELDVDGAISTTTSDYVQGTTGSRLIFETAGSGNTHSYIQAQNTGGTSNAEDLALQLYGGNVGIGTDSPSQKLEVDGNIHATGSRHISAIYNADNYIRFESNASGGVLKGTDGGVITTFIKTYGDSYFNGGNLGIGTSTPGESLEVNHSSTPKMRFRRGASYYWDIGHTGSDFQFESQSGGTIMHLNYDGNVGVGTVAPQSKLQVNGGVQMADDSDAASASKVGTIKYREDANNSYVDMCMKTGAATYAWINITQNNW